MQADLLDSHHLHQALIQQQLFEQIPAAMTTAAAVDSGSADHMLHSRGTSDALLAPDELESKSCSENVDGGGGGGGSGEEDDEQDPNQRPRKKKRYHRHTQHQIQELEA
jgi:homeobox-leucine zipper protein